MEVGIEFSIENLNTLFGISEIWELVMGTTLNQGIHDFQKMIFLNATEAVLGKEFHVNPKKLMKLMCPSCRLSEVHVWMSFKERVCLNGLLNSLWGLKCFGQPKKLV
jgi:hypothetical protein